MGGVWGQEHRPGSERSGQKDFPCLHWASGAQSGRLPSHTEWPLPAQGDLGSTLARPLVCVFRLMPHRISSARKSCFR